MQLSDDMDPWDRILQRKADEAPVIVQQKAEHKKVGLIAIGIGVLIAAFLIPPTRKESQ